MEAVAEMVKLAGSPASVAHNRIPTRAIKTSAHGIHGAAAMLKCFAMHFRFAMDANASDRTRCYRYGGGQNEWHFQTMIPRSSRVTVQYN